jgi:hypothetical protein
MLAPPIRDFRNGILRIDTRALNCSAKFHANARVSGRFVGKYGENRRILRRCNAKEAANRWICGLENLTPT